LSRLHPISGCDDAARQADVVFVHGLGGDAFGTWRHGKDESTSWPHWLGPERALEALDLSALLKSGLFRLLFGVDGRRQLAQTTETVHRFFDAAIAPSPSRRAPRP